MAGTCTKNTQKAFFCTHGIEPRYPYLRGTKKGKKEPNKETAAAEAAAAKALPVNGLCPPKCVCVSVDCVHFKGGYFSRADLTTTAAPMARTYVIVGAAFLVSFLEMGTLKSFGVLFNPMLESMQCSTAELGAVLGMPHSLALIIGEYQY